MFMCVLVDMRMTVHELFVPVRVLMDEVGLQEEIGIGKKFLRLSVGYDFMVVAQNNYAGRHLLDYVQVLSAEDHALVFISPAKQEIDEAALAPGVQAVGRFVEEEHLGLQRKNGGEGYLLFLSAGEAVRRSLPQMVDIQQF